MKKIIFILTLFFCSKTDAQVTLQAVEAMEQAKKACVEGKEPGRSQIFCVGRFKDQLDSLMQVVYGQLNDRASESYQQILRKEQAEWLEKRMASDAEIEAMKKEGMTDAALRIYKYDLKTQFLRDRVKYLISKL